MNFYNFFSIQDTGSIKKSPWQPTLSKIFWLGNIVLSQFFFLILISYVGEKGHILGEIGYQISLFLITHFFGLTAFFLPLGWFYLSFSLFKKHRNISEIIRHLFWFYLSFFWFSVLILNTPLINTPWAGLLPKFFHALISRAFQGVATIHPLVVGFELGLFLIFTLLLIKSYSHWSYKEIYDLVKRGLAMVGFFKGKAPHENERSFLKVTKNKWIDFWKDLFDCVDKINETEVQKYMGGNIPSFSNGFALIRLDRYHNSIDETENKENTSPNRFSDPVNFYPQEEEKSSSDDNVSASGKETLEDEVIPFTKSYMNFQTVQKGKEDEESQKGMGDEVGEKEVIDLSWKKFFRNINGEEEDIINALVSNEEKVEKVSQKEESDQAEIIPLVINPKKGLNGLNNQKCLADVEKLVFSLNPARSKTLDLEIKNTCGKLEKTIKEFGINTQVVNVSQGPVITQYELTLEPGVHINKIVNLSDNIALSLAAESVRIVAPIPGKAVIGIEIPNKTREMVTLRDIVDKQVFQDSTANLPIALGASVSGKPILTDLASTPHLLVAGATGSGKSVCVNSIICSLLLRLTPAEVRFLMIDPKMVELNMYNGIPHLLAPVITDSQKAALTLKWAITEMDSRYRLLERSGVRNISSYNHVVKKEKNFEYGTLPYIVIIIDEFADLMMVARKEIEDSVSRLAAMSRAIGIHLLLATQRPSVDVITGVIKANFPSRIAFQVSSKIDSRTIIDTMGAEKLLGKGDMLYQNAATGNPHRIQGTFLSDKEVKMIVSGLKHKGETQYVLNLKEDLSASPENSSEWDDEIFQEAMELAKKEGKISTSLIQRRLRIGYNRAARIVETMEERGIVGASDGIRPREVLVSNF